MKHRTLKLVAVPVTILAVLLLLCLVVRSVRSGSPGGTTVGTSSGTHWTYSTNFPLTERPISEGGNWINGQTAGLDWADVRTTRAFAFGTESGRVKYDDSTALLAGNWGPDQTAEATVHSVNQTDNFSEEVELRLRSSLSPHEATGYEINFRCSKTANAYAEIVRWNGRLGDFTYLKRKSGSQYGVADGDIVRAAIVGNVITAYINGVPVLQAKDRTYATGSPGMGFYTNGDPRANSDFGFASFRASDQSQASTGRTVGENE